MNVERVAGHRIDPAVGETLAGENQGMHAFVVDDGELYILFEWSFDWQSPHYQTLPTIHRVNRTRGCHSGTPIIQPAGFGLTGISRQVWVLSAEIDPTSFGHLSIADIPCGSPAHGRPGHLPAVSHHSGTMRRRH
ncbi:hypothetical protein FHT80_000113 [Rhizobium sp. BK226]|uniref:hypothetical protein n=1 Tax=Rhizobium sp. BK226 TaxID=2587075 RepID=UPI001613ABD7|nr:hypothetical protein [Rhizobium sp. BK226]